MIVYQALFCHMTEESSYETLSLHLTKEGAQTVLDEHKNSEYNHWRNLYSKKDEPYEFGYFQDWMVGETEVLP